MATLWGLMAGKKTYMAAIGMVVLAVAELFLGDVPLGLQTMLGAMAAAAGLRSAIAQSHA